MYYARNISTFVVIKVALDLNKFVVQVYLFSPFLKASSLPLTHADSVVVGITVACVLLLVLITLMVTVGYFILKTDAVEKGIPTVLSS